MGLSYSNSIRASQLKRAGLSRRKDLEQMQACKRGEHLYVTGCTNCPHCGEDY